MQISQVLLGEWDREIPNTRKVLERVPEEKFGWKPHPKSGTLVWLATHVANLPMWPQITIERDELDLESGPTPPPPPTTRAELLDLFDKNAAAGRAALAAAGNERLMAPWTLRIGETTLFTMPRTAVLRGFVMNHLIHHRAQLTVYLRLNDVPVPALYGPSADEQAF
jgi:uncharacterized damage-inducible protein DinB